MRNKQKTFRNRLKQGTKNKCEVTQSRLVKCCDACHIKPFSLCNEEEKYDQNNSILMLASIHRAFDNGYLTFNDYGEIIISYKIKEWEYECLGLNGKERIIMPGRRKEYMKFHRENIFIDNQKIIPQL